jgi:hypothetical protein
MSGEPERKTEHKKKDIKWKTDKSQILVIEESVKKGEKDSE